MATSFGFVSTFPPTQCGLATFTASLREAMVQPDASSGMVVRLVEAPERRPSTEVVAQLVIGDQRSLQDSVRHLNGCDVAIVQHEYGIFGGRDGDEVLALLDGLDVPTIVVLHTVPVAPTTHQREVLEAVVRKADAVVTMSVTATDRLAAGYDVDLQKVRVIAHGAQTMHSAAPGLSPVFRTGQPTILTWGLLGPGKGIEWGIEAMARLGDVQPTPSYIIAGQTHPKVALRDGEAYRTSLVEKVRSLGLQGSVSFDAHYRDTASLTRLVQSADIVLLPYDSTDQVTSGVLIEAVAAGKPVVATRFPHAIELLSGGAGLLVAHRNPEQIAQALRTLITNDNLAREMSRIAAAAAPCLSWSAVAEQYRELADQLISARVAA